MSPSFRILVGGVAALALSQSPLHGQGSPEQDIVPEAAGRRARVEVQSPGGPRVLEGSLRRAGRDSVVVEVCRWACRRVAVPALRVGELAIHRGRPGSVGRTVAGGILGLLGGAALGGALGMRGCNPDDPCLAPVYYGGIGAVFGLFTGAGTGYALSPEWWQVVPGYPPRR
jgi:hypothetical protein